MSPNAFSKKKILEIKNLLIKERNRISSLCLKNESNFVQDIGGDEGDSAQANIINSLQETLSQKDFFKLKRINEAIKKIENSNDFGICEECGELIAEKRILAIPGCIYCISCAEIEEKNNKVNNL